MRKPWTRVLWSIRLIYYRFVPPFGVRLLRKYSRRFEQVRILDIGCGTVYPQLFRLAFGTECEYVGLDKFPARVELGDKVGLFDIRFADLEKDVLRSLPPAEKYSVINFSHVIEHLDNGNEVLAALREHQEMGGLLYVETPSDRSLGFPSRAGCLYFYDDDTHKRVYTLEEMEQTLLNSGYEILRIGIRHDPFRVAIAPFVWISLVLAGRKIKGGNLWDIVGFAHYILAKVSVVAG